jgi:hypothetical protein
MSAEPEKEKLGASRNMVPSTGRLGLAGGRATMVVGSSGYVAVLDVLGFRALVAADHNNAAVIRYLGIIETSLAESSNIQSIVFSDSIVLALHGKQPENLRLLCEACSRLMYDLITEDIPIRGAIACGDFATSNVNSSAFIAGKPIIEAYEFEQKQDWTGVMLAPSALKAAPIIKDQCTTVFYNDEAFPDLPKYLEWKAYTQHCPAIPFHSGNGGPIHDGFAIVPGGSTSLDSMVTNLSGVITRLEWLKLIAPTPGDQAKYSATLDWLRRIQGIWQSRAQEHKQWLTKQCG